MPELPEVENVRRTLKSIVEGKEIEKVEVLYSKIITGDVKEFKKAVEGHKITDIKRVGKYLVFILEDIAILSHLRMEGKYRYLPSSMLVTEEKENSIVEAHQHINKHDHLIFVFTDRSCLLYNDVRKFGRLQLVNKENYSNNPPLNQLGPEPWNTDVNYLYQKIHKSNLPIKAILLEQNIIAGIGNIYANEICFRMGLNPNTLGNKLSKKRVEELIEVTKEILEKSITLGGTSIHTFSSVGVSGEYQQELKVHGQKQCLVCGGEISKEKIKGRGTYYCKHCQRKRK
jgi:formamidopyrimidine-DNA glycosylase